MERWPDAVFVHVRSRRFTELRASSWTTWLRFVPDSPRFLPTSCLPSVPSSSAYNATEQGSRVVYITFACFLFVVLKSCWYLDFHSRNPFIFVERNMTY
jgi:hypothetical protein